jgi:elongation factor Ts
MEDTLEIGTAMVKELREKTGAGVLDCKKALEGSAGDMDKALQWLREKGLAGAAKKASRTTGQGVVTSYIHPGSKIGVLVEVNCETDFVARLDDFQALAHDISMQIAASRPEWLTADDVPADVKEREREIYRTQAESEGKPPKAVEAIVEGRLKKFYAEFCLLEQPFIKNPDLAIKDLVSAKILSTGENIKVSRFVRYELGK